MTHDSYLGRVSGGANENEVLWIEGEGFPTSPDFRGWRLRFCDMDVELAGARISDNGDLEVLLLEPLSREPRADEFVTIASD